MSRKNGHKRIMSYMGHVIWVDSVSDVYMVALKRDGTDDYFDTLTDAVDAIEKHEEQARGRMI